MNDYLGSRTAEGSFLFVMRSVLGLLFSILFGLIVLSFMASVHPIGDSIAVFRAWIAIALLIVVILLVRGTAKFVGLVALVVMSVASPVAGNYYHATQDQAGPYTLYQKNLLYLNENQEALIADFRDVRADFITMQELWPVTLPVWRGLLDLYHHRLKCFGRGGNSASILSRWPFVDETKICRDDLGFSAGQVELPEGRVWIVSLHLPWPYPFAQSDRVAKIVPILESLDGPVILGGDFNMVPWSRTMSLVEAAAGSERAGPILQSFRGAGGLLRLPIDHVLTPNGKGTVETRPYLGSDHKGLLLRFSL